MLGTEIRKLAGRIVIPQRKAVVPTAGEQIKPVRASRLFVIRNFTKMAGSCFCEPGLVHSDQFLNDILAFARTRINACPCVAVNLEAEFAVYAFPQPLRFLADGAAKFVSTGWIHAKL
jgi:hypothetical protein